jgi:hypothetical protein
LSENNATHNNKFNETLALVKTELEFEKQKLRLLTKSDGVYCEAVIVQNQNKIYTFDESNDTQNLIRITGAKVYQGNVIDDIYPFNNIGDLVVAVFRTGEEFATDLSKLNHDILDLKSKTTMRVLMQGIEKQGHEDYADLSSFVDQCVAKHVINEQGERTTFYGTVIEIYCLLLNLHGNDPVENAQLKVIFDFQEHHDVIDVNTLSEYIINYHSVG